MLKLIALNYVIIVNSTYSQWLNIRKKKIIS